MGKFFITSGPSGVGKTTLMEAIESRHEGRVATPVSYTTRQPREGEIDGKHYHFISEDEFNNKLGEGAFIEWAKVYGNMYAVGKSPVLETTRNYDRSYAILNYDGAKQFRAISWPATYIFTAPTSLSALEKRLYSRGHSNNTPHRIREAKAELATRHNYDYVIINDEFDKAVEELEEVMGL